MKTDIGSRFLKLVDQYREINRETPLKYVFSRAVIKFDYSATKNMKAHIAAHNSRLLNNRNAVTTEDCNCIIKETCPLDGLCQTKSLVYKATVTSNLPRLEEGTYHGLTEHTFKKRWYGHKHDISNKESKGTTLSKHIHKIKDLKESLQPHARENITWNIRWEIKEKVAAYKPGDKNCKLCAAEKHHIFKENDKISLNLRSELLSKCRHKRKFKLANFLPKPPKKPPATPTT